MCFNMYEVELSNKQGEKVDKLIEYIKREQLVRVIHLTYNFFPEIENLIHRDWEKYMEMHHSDGSCGWRSNKELEVLFSYLSC